MSKKITHADGFYLPHIAQIKQCIVLKVNTFLVPVLVSLCLLLAEKLPESTESSKFVSHRARMPMEFDLRKDSQSKKFKQRPQIFVKLSFRELCDSKLSGLHPFHNTAIIN